MPVKKALPCILHLVRPLDGQSSGGSRLIRNLALRAEHRRSSRWGSARRSRDRIPADRSRLSRWFKPTSLAIALAAGAAIAVSACAQEAPLQAGFAQVDITPPVGYRMSGYFYERFSTGVHDPLQARAIVLQQGAEQAAWIICDLIGVPADVSGAARDAIAERTGIPREHIVVAATHSHTGPLYFGPLRNYFHDRALELAGSDAHEAVAYPEALVDNLADAAAQAVEVLAPMELYCAVSQQLGLSFNRRYVMSDGSVKTNPGKLNPNIARPAGPIDPDLGLLQFRRGGEAVAGLTVFALHLDTTGGTEYSADYANYLHRTLQEEFGSQYLSVFAAGTCGDVNHFDVSHDRPQKGSDEAKRIGEAIGATALQGLREAAPVSQPALQSASKIIKVPLQQYTPDQRRQAREDLAQVGARVMPMLEQVAAVKIVGIDDLGVAELPMEVQAFRLSDTMALVTLPGEIFAELGLLIKRRSPFPTTFVVELSNDYPGYIPTRRAFAEGGYEPTNSKIAPGGGEALAEAAIELLNELELKQASNGARSR